VLGEYLNSTEIGGAFIVLTGIYLVNRKTFKRQVNIEPEF
jgi:drug/metabolite transporter (DMT)-like permease